MAETLQLDAKAWQLLMALQEDGRAPLKSLAEAAGLSVPATAERLKRLKESGVVRAVAADVDPAHAGYPVRAIVGITVATNVLLFSNSSSVAQAVMYPFAALGFVLGNIHQGNAVISVAALYLVFGVSGALLGRLVHRVVWRNREGNAGV